MVAAEGQEEKMLNKANSTCSESRERQAFDSHSYI